MNKHDMFNEHIKAFNCQSYLEIGVQNGACYERIKCQHKVGVEPTKTVANELIPGVHFRDSDSFFNNNNARFDLCFVDGLHKRDQVLRDISNAVKITNKFVFVHDVMPDDEKYTAVPRQTRRWFGDVFKSWHCALDAYPLAFTIDEDCGLGVIPIQNNNHLFGSLDTHVCKDVSYDEYMASDLRIEPWDYLIQ